MTTGFRLRASGLTLPALGFGLWALGLAGAITAPLFAQDQRKATVWDKIYTEDQAKRGEAVYAKSCAACHGEQLIGGNAPPLKGDEFAFLWGDKSLGELFERMSTLMPPESPNSLSKDTYRDVVAFVLKTNAYPSGDKGLPADQAELEKIFITGKP